jgi:hypothetical protein
MSALYVDHNQSSPLWLFGFRNGYTLSVTKLQFTRRMHARSPLPYSLRTQALFESLEESRFLSSGVRQGEALAPFRHSVQLRSIVSLWPLKIFKRSQQIGSGSGAGGSERRGHGSPLGFIGRLSRTSTLQLPGGDVTNIWIWRRKP